MAGSHNQFEHGGTAKEKHNQKKTSNLSFSHLFDDNHSSTQQSIIQEAEFCSSPETKSNCLATSLPNHSKVEEFTFSSLFPSNIDTLPYDNSLTVSGELLPSMNISRGGFPSNYKNPKESLEPSLSPKPRSITTPFIQDWPARGSPSSFEPTSYKTFATTGECEVILGDGTKTRRRVSLSSSFDPSASICNETREENQTSEAFISTRPLLGPGSLVEAPKPIEQPSKSYWCSQLEKMLSFELTQQNKAVLKSTLSYFLGSILTFIPYMRSLVGTSSHMAAISGFFLNPGQSIGSFVESMVYGILFLFYGLAVGYLSLANMVFWNSLGFPTIARSTTLFLFIGVASFILAYIKASYPKPTVVKCIPNAFIFIYIVLINYTPFAEDTFDPFKIYDLAKSLACGILINFIICTQLWARWEADKLRDDMVETLKSFQHTLSVIVKTFLLEESDQDGEKNVDKIMEAHRLSFLNLKKRYEASRWEFYFDMDQYQRLGKAVDRLNRLSQKMGGLSSGIDAQKELLEMSGMTNIKDHLKSYISAKSKRHSKLPNRHMSLFPINIPTSIDSAASKSNEQPSSSESEPDVEVLFLFLKYVNPPTKSLTYTCKQAISHLIGVVERLNKTGNRSNVTFSEDSISPAQLRENINSALDLFTKAQSKAMSTLYKRTRYDGRPDEEIFLVYFFVFSLEEFANELILTITAIEELIRDPPPSQAVWWINFKTPFSAPWMVIKSLVADVWDKFTRHSSHLKAGEQIHALHTPDPRNLYQRALTQFWYFLMGLRDHRIIFASKSAIAALIVASPAYLGGYQKLFFEWRVGWTLITLNLVMSPTVGASNVYAIYRTAGTIAGSLLAFVVYSIFSHNPIALTIVSTAIAAPCMYMFLCTGIPRFGQFLLLSYNLIVLTTYSNRHDVEFSFAEYAFIRSFSVIMGVVIGLLVSALVFPYEARKELRLGLSRFFLEVSVLYQKLVEMYSIPPTKNANLNEQSPLLGSTHSDDSCSLFINEHPYYAKEVHEFLERELDLQLQLLELGGLLPHTLHEPRLKGTFPTPTYRKILKSCQLLLDKFLAMRIVITKEEWQARVREDFVIPLNAYRADLVGSIILYFYILASSLHLKSPLPPYLPPAAEARRRLVTALRELPVVRNRFLHEDDDHHIVYYAFIVVIDDIISELDELGCLFKSLYGSQGDAAFQDLFKS